MRTFCSALVVSAVVMLAGCVVPVRFAVGPTIDTSGNLGLDARVSFGTSMGVKEAGLGIAGQLGVGVPTGPQNAPLVGGLDLGIYSFSPRRQLSFYSGVGWATRGIAGRDGAENGLGLHLGLSTPVYESHKPRGRRILSEGKGLRALFGGAVHYEHLWSGDTSRGLVFLPLVLETRFSTEL